MARVLLMVAGHLLGVTRRAKDANFISGDWVKNGARRPKIIRGSAAV